jgi:phytoene dehydrogenase-like protein
VAVVGSGPNGLAAAVYLARAGCRVQVIEQAAYLGGGLSTRELIEPGFLHDVCAAVPAMALESKFFQKFELNKRVDFVTPEVSYANPLEHDRPGLAYRDIDRTSEELGRDGPAWKSLLQPLVDYAPDVVDFAMNTMLRIPSRPLLAARFGARTFEQGLAPSWNMRWHGQQAPALLTGAMAHAVSKLPSLGASGVGLVLAALAHRQGWPFPVGGAQSIADAMIDDIRKFGGTFSTNTTVRSIDELDDFDAVILNISTAQFLRLAEGKLPPRYRRALERFRYGKGSAKVDFALTAPIPWRDPELTRAGTVHLGGTRNQIIRSDTDSGSGNSHARPFVLLTQPSIFDATRAPKGRHTAWAYIHVPPHSRLDPTEAITREIERFAPGFRDLIVGSHAESAEQLAVRNPNYVGGDISAGEISLRQLLQRPVLSRSPWRTPLSGIYLASASTTPGPSIHGLAGYHAARLLAAEQFGIVEEPDLSL